MGDPGGDVVVRVSSIRTSWFHDLVRATHLPTNGMRPLSLHIIQLGPLAREEAAAREGLEMRELLLSSAI
jgi:hypothetical protein